MRIKYIVLILFFLSEIVYGVNLNYNKQSLKGLSETYGFIIGQKIGLSKIEKKYPDLANDVLLIRSSFNASFPKIEDKLKIQLISGLGKENFIKMDHKMKKQLSSFSARQKITKDIAKAYLGKIEMRAKGEIDSPILEYMLAVKYVSSPADELLDGYYQNFSSKKYKKAQGLDIKLKVPKSWKAEEGRRPHMVQRWTNQNGTGLASIMLLISDRKMLPPSRKELESFISSGMAKKTLPKNTTYIDSNVFTIENMQGYWIDTSIKSDRAGLNMYMRSIAYQSFYKKKIVRLECTFGDSQNNIKEVNLRFKEIKNMCQKVLNSLVLLNTYSTE